MTDKTVVRKAFPVMASSPQPSRYSIWRKQRYSVPIEFMPLWTRDELKKGLEIHPFYADLRQDVKTELCSASIDDSLTIPVSPKKLIREVCDNVILSALEMIRHGGDAMDDATGDSATDNTTIEVDEVLDKMLDNTIEAYGNYGSSARDGYEAIFSPVVAKEGLIKAVSAQEYHALRNTVRGLGRADAGHPFSHTIFSMDLNKGAPLGFEVRFKSHWIKSMVLRQLKFLQHLDNAAMIEEMNDMSSSSSFAGFLYEGFATKELLAARESSPDLALMKTEEGKTTFFVPIEPDTTMSPFNRQRERSYASFSTGPLALELNVPSEKSLAGYFWIPMTQNNALFDAFVIEFKNFCSRD